MTIEQKQFFIESTRRNAIRTVETFINEALD